MKAWRSFEGASAVAWSIKTCVSALVWLLAALLGAATGAGVPAYAQGVETQAGKPKDLPPVGELILESHKSDFLQATKQFYVVLPRSYDGKREFPVIYVLHGAWGSYKDWPSHMDVTKLANAYDVILVFPDGGQFGWYLDSPVEPKSQYESYIIKELIPYIDSHYLTIANARGRGIVGLSMGGHGAITLAFKHPDLFASASSLSGVLDLTRHSNDFELPKRLGSIRTNRAAWEANSALHLARQLTPDFPVKLFVDVGTSDFTLAANRAFAKEVTGRGVPLKYVERPGTHDWAYWTGNIAEHIAFHAAAFPAVQ